VLRRCKKKKKEASVRKKLSKYFPKSTFAYIKVIII